MVPPLRILESLSATHSRCFLERRKGSRVICEFRPCVTPPIAQRLASSLRVSYHFVVWAFGGALFTCAFPTRGHVGWTWLRTDFRRQRISGVALNSAVRPNLQASGVCPDFAVFPHFTLRPFRIRTDIRRKLRRPRRGEPRGLGFKNKEFVKGLATPSGGARNWTYFLLTCSPNWELPLPTKPSSENGAGFARAAEYCSRKEIAGE